MEQTILTEQQREVIALMATEPQMNHFYLSGGTALAEYHLKHRLSDDLDFFTEKEIDMTFLHSFSKRVQEKINAPEVRFQRLYDRNIFLFEGSGGGELKVEWTRYPFPRLEKLLSKDGILVDDLRDITANKLMAMLDRFDPKDFVDLYFLLQNRSLEKVREDAEKKFSVKIELLFLGSELSKVSRIKALPKIYLPVTISQLKVFFESLAESLSPSILEN